MKPHRFQVGRFTGAWVLLYGVLLTACGGGGGATPASVPPLTIASTSLADGTTGQPYSQGLRATGGQPPYTWSLPSGRLPAGVILNSTGVVSGTPTEAGRFDFTARVKDSASRSDSRTLTLVVAQGLVITTTSLPDAWYSQPYSQTLSAIGGTPPYTWSVYAGGIPGLELSSSGIISGIPDMGWGQFVITPQVKDSLGQTATRQLNLNLTSAMTINSALVQGNIAASYWGVMYLSGGVPPYTWSLAPSSRPLPPGLSLASISSTGEVTGIPTEAGTYNFTVQVSDSGSPTQTITQNETILITNNLFFTRLSLPIGVRGFLYRASCEVAAGTPPYTWTLTGTMPPGLSFSSSGEVSGTPSEEGNFSFGLSVTDSGSPPQSLTGVVYMTVNPPLSLFTTSLPDAVQGGWYFSQVSSTGGIPSFSLQITSGALPAGLNFSASTSDWGYFVLQGSPTQTGLFTFTLQVTDSFSPPETAAREFTIHVAERLAITTTSLPAGWTNQPYSVTLQATGGTPPYFWSADSLPPGFALDPTTGQLSGTMTTDYSYGESFMFRARDSASPPQAAWATLSLTMTAPLVIATSRLPAGRPNVPYRVGLAIKGGWGNDTWRVSAGSLPAGLTIDQGSPWTDTAITGTPTAGGTSTFTLTATEQGPPPQTATRELSLRISSSLGRNDSVATATPISNGTMHASLSPFSEPVSGPATPDSDYYALTANAGSIVRLETDAHEGVSPASPVDTVIEILDSSGVRYNTCNSPADYVSTYDQPCLNDDESPGFQLDSLLYFKVPGTPGTVVTFYVHVLDWSGNARPDFLYNLVIIGAN